MREREGRSRVLSTDAVSGFYQIRFVIKRRRHDAPSPQTSAVVFNGARDRRVGFAAVPTPAGGSGTFGSRRQRFAAACDRGTSVRARRGAADVRLSHVPHAVPRPRALTTCSRAPTNTSETGPVRRRRRRRTARRATETHRTPRGASSWPVVAVTIAAPCVVRPPPSAPNFFSAASADRLPAADRGERQTHYTVPGLFARVNATGRRRIREGVTCKPSAWPRRLWRIHWPFQPIHTQ